MVPGRAKHCQACLVVWMNVENHMVHLELFLLFLLLFPGYFKSLLESGSAHTSLSSRHRYVRHCLSSMTLSFMLPQYNISTKVCLPLSDTESRQVCVCVVLDNSCLSIVYSVTTSFRMVDCTPCLWAVRLWWEHEAPLYYSQAPSPSRSTRCLILNLGPRTDR